MHMSLGELRELVMDREAWCAVIHGVTKSQTRLSDWAELNWVIFLLNTSNQIQSSFIVLHLLPLQHYFSSTMMINSCTLESPERLIEHTDGCAHTQNFWFSRWYLKFTFLTRSQWCWYSGPGNTLWELLVWIYASQFQRHMRITWTLESSSTQAPQAN